MTTTPVYFMAPYVDNIRLIRIGECKYVSRQETAYPLSAYVSVDELLIEGSGGVSTKIRPFQYVVVEDHTHMLVTFMSSDLYHKIFEFTRKEDLQPPFHHKEDFLREDANQLACISSNVDAAFMSLQVQLLDFSKEMEKSGSIAKSNMFHRRSATLRDRIHKLQKAWEDELLYTSLAKRDLL